MAEHPEQQVQQRCLVLDPTEVSLGISSYLSEDVPGFSAVTKARFSDFVVHEVGIDGRIARLDNIEAVVVSPSLLSTDKTRITTVSDQRNETTDTNFRKRKLDDGSTSDEPDWALLKIELEAFVGNDMANEVISFLQSMETEDAPKDDENVPRRRQFVLLPPLAEKEQRRALHEWIKERLSFSASADTLDGQIRIWHRSMTTFMPNKLDNKKHKAHSVAPREMPFIRFVLYKENMDTGAAMQQISRRGSFKGGSRGGSGGRGKNGRIRLGYAGNKDKRGITSQFITIPVRDTSVKHLCNVFNSSKGDRAESGGGHTRSAGVGLLRIGNFEYCKDELQLGRLCGNRFDVVLRNVQVSVDSSAVDCKDINTSKGLLERAAEAIKQNGFINYFGTQRFGKYHNTHLTGMAVLRGDYEAAVNMILEPQGSDREDVHAARVQWQNRFQDASDNRNDRAAVEREVAGIVLKAMNGFMQSENAILSSLVREPLDYKKAFSCIAKTMRMMFIHALQSFLWNKVASFRIDTMGQKVVQGDLVLDNSDNLRNDAVRNGGDGCPNVRVVTDDDLAADRYTIFDVVLPLIGAKTRNPENQSGAVFDAILKEHNLTSSMIDNLDDHNFHCAGDYRKLICRPTDVDFDIVEYNDELQPLLQTDYMKLQGINVDRIGDNLTKSLNGADSLLALVIGFTLPSSSYATVFLRELMKRPTSSEYQRDLQLGGQQDDKIPEEKVVECDA